METKRKLSLTKFSHLCLGLCVVASTITQAQHSGKASSAGESTRGESWMSKSGDAGTANWKRIKEPLVLWNECSGRLKGGYNGDYTTQYDFPKKNPKHSQWNSSLDVNVTKPDCTKRPMSAALYTFMNDTFPGCVASASGTGMKAKDIVSINTTHVGVRGDDRHRSSSPGSYHNINRAIDVTGFVVKFSTDRSERSYNHAMAAYANLKKRNGKTLTKAEQEQYDFFIAFKACISKAGGGTISFEHRQHQGHIHVSVPSRALVKAGFYNQ